MQLINKLFDIEAIKFGTFTLKSGITSPIYIDLRMIVSYPELLDGVAEAIWRKVKDLEFDLICGVPYTALPIATAISLAHNKPMVMRRKEAKDHGTKKFIEGAFKPGQICLVIEDLITSGASIVETIAPLQDVGLKVCDAAVLIDREQGGKANIASKGLKLHAAFTISEMLHHLQTTNKLDSSTVTRVLEFIKQRP